MLRRQKHVLSQSTTPFACTLQTEKGDQTLFGDLLFPEAPAILYLRSDVFFGSDLIFALPCKRENKIGSKI